MALALYYHPLASFCHKVLIALYEAGRSFEAHIVDLGNPDEHSRFLDIWPVGKMPVLHDDKRDRTIPETSIIIEYLDRHHPGPHPMLPADPDVCLQVRLWDRFFDLYVQEPIQKIVGDRIRRDDTRDPAGVEEAERRLATAYVMIDRQTADHGWAVGEDFTMADCAAAPALFYAGILQPFPERHGKLHAYFDLFPYRDRMPERFLELRDA